MEREQKLEKEKVCGVSWSLGGEGAHRAKKGIEGYGEEVRGEEKEGRLNYQTYSSSEKSKNGRTKST